MMRTTGIVETFGSVIRLRFTPRLANASVIDKLDGMDALLLGKLTTTEFANL
ncbi:MAG: hypothetical protein ACSLEN_03870 [Candidatus Malihini olakiniferum]